MVTSYLSTFQLLFLLLSFSPTYLPEQNQINMPWMHFDISGQIQIHDPECQKIDLRGYLGALGCRCPSKVMVFGAFRTAL